jgi:hypothetical protein
LRKLAADADEHHSYSRTATDEQAVTTVVCIGKTDASRQTFNPSSAPANIKHNANKKHATGVQAIHSNMLFLAVDRGAIPPHRKNLGDIVADKPDH